MKLEEKQICRLCFDIADHEFNEINEIMGDMLEVLLLEINWNINENPRICRTCISVIKKLFNFKSVCIHTEKLVASFAGNKEAIFQMNDIVQNKRFTEMATKEHSRCRFCMNSIKYDNFVSVDTLMEEALYKKMFPLFMIEIDFSIVKNPIVCTPCKQNLASYFVFIRNLLDIEKKLYIYCQKIGTNSLLGIKPDDILQFLKHDNLKGSDKYAWIHFEKWKLTTSEEKEKMSPSRLMKIEETLDIKDEEVLLNDNFCKDLSEIALDEDELCHKEENKLVQSSICLEANIYSCKVATQNQYCDTNTIDTVKHTCTLCTYSAKYKYLIKQHMLTHKSTSEVDTYKCSQCPYKTKSKSNLKRHTLVHQDASEVKMYDCEFCIYRTKYKCTLERHVLTHKNASEVDTFKCPHCPYMNKLKARLKRHLLIHKDASEVELFKCESCPYMSIYKNYLQQHALTHKDASKVQTYRCLHCPYETKWKHHLKSHMIVHEDASDVKMYNCELCTYMTKYKRTLELHGLTHKKAPKVKMYKCSDCPYETKWKCRLKNHMIVHRNESEVEMYKCKLCTFATKYKRTLELHALTHKSPSELKMYKCSFCPHETKWKNLLKRHILTHKDPSELQMHKCPMCDFESKYKSSLKKHVLNYDHNVSKVRRNKCTT